MPRRSSVANTTCYHWYYPLHLQILCTPNRAPVPLTTPPGRSRRKKRRCRQIRKGLKVFTRPGIEVGRLGPQLRLHEGKRRPWASPPPAGQTGQGSPQTQSTPPGLTITGACSRKPPRRRERQQEKGEPPYLTQRSTSPRPDSISDPPPMRPSMLASVACRRRESSDNAASPIGPPPKDPLATNAILWPAGRRD